MKRCTSSGKVRHSNKTKARKTKAHVGNAGLEEYFCHDCGGWHLGTSHNPWLQQARIDQLLGKQGGPPTRDMNEVFAATIADIKHGTGIA